MQWTKALSAAVRNEDELRQQLAHVKSDNIKLYEKVRFLTTYHGMATPSMRDVKVTFQRLVHGPSLIHITRHVQKRARILTSE
jgi:hypothetical protein